MMLVVAFVGVAGGFFTYGVMLLLLRLIPPLSLIVAFVLFYGSIGALVIFLVERVYSLAVGVRQSPMEEATRFALTIATYFGIAAAAFGAINHPRVSSAFRRFRPSRETAQ